MAIRYVCLFENLNFNLLPLLGDLECTTFAWLLIQLKQVAQLCLVKLSALHDIYPQSFAEFQNTIKKQRKLSIAPRAATRLDRRKRPSLQILLKANQKGITLLDSFFFFFNTPFCEPQDGKVSFELVHLNSVKNLRLLWIWFWAEDKS